MANNMFPLRLSDTEKKILELRAEALGVSQSDLIRELIWFDGICPSSHRITTKIRQMPKEERDRILAEIVDRLESDDPAKIPSFNETLKEAADEVSATYQDSVADKVIEKLLGSEAKGDGR